MPFLDVLGNARKSRIASAFLSRKWTRKNGKRERVCMVEAGIRSHERVDTPTYRDREDLRGKRNEEKKKGRTPFGEKGKKIYPARRGRTTIQSDMVDASAACRNVGAPLPLAGGARGWAGFLSRQRARIHPVHVGTEGFRIDRRPGEQPCSDWLSQTARPCRVDSFLARWNEESRTSELSSWLPLVEQQPRARPKRTIDEEGVCSRVDKDDRQTHAQEGEGGKR